MAGQEIDHTPRFITFEGGEGVGKSTQVKLLLEKLHNEGVGTVRTREPGGTPRAEAIRSFILSGQPQSWGTGAEAVLFAAARLDHVNELVAPSLEAGKWVLSDRFHDSTRAYQGLNGGVDTKLIDALEILALNGHTPDLTIVLDMDPEKAFERVEKRALEDGIPISADRFEREDLEWHRRLRDAFHDIVKNNEERCVMLSADQSEEELAEEVWALVRGRFPEIESVATG
ncbi:MAG: dTMP kinase [Hyphomicrobiaceae bacterium]|nr:dTMP kinase [Hyphomicrobiaceae bacterium]MCC0023417.1 dTMP kinase [Hyphomicrobiaceae bacterium]